MIDDNNNKKILFVTSDEYPFDGANTNILKTLFDCNSFLKGFDIFVMAKKRHPILSDFDDNILYYIEPSEEDAFLDLNKYKTKFVKFFIKILRVIKVSFDKKKACSNNKVKAVYKTLVENKHLGFDFIVAVMGGKFYESKAVLKFSKRYKIPYLLYQLDPCMNNECEGKDSFKDRKRLELLLYKNAVHIITTPIIYNIHSHDTLNRYDFKTSVMEFPLVCDKVKKRHININKTLCVFAGALYNPIRLPHYTIKLFEAISGMNDLEVWFVGRNCSQYNSYNTPLHLICEEAIDRNEVGKLLDECDYFVNIGNTVINQIPSKIFDYISRGKPIINICKTENCPSLKYLKTYPLALNIIESDDFDFNVAKLKSFLLKKRNVSMPYSIIEEKFRECTALYCSKVFTKIVEEYI